MPVLLHLQELQGKGDGKASFYHFLADQKIVSVKKCFLGILSHEQQVIAARHILTMGLQKCLSSWHFKLHKFTVTAFHCEESMHWK